MLRLCPLVIALVAASAAAQVPPAAAPSDIVVEGRRARPSNWREAETQHVIVLSNGGETELVEIAHNLERLHFLLAALFGRIDKPDDTVKLRVTLIGDTAEFEAMDLRNRRWQQGPFAPAFAASRYYDPREDGAVLASTRIDQKAVLRPGVSIDSLQGIQLSGGGTLDPGAAAIQNAAIFGLSSQTDLPMVNEVSVPLGAENMIYAGYAQHFLQTYFPAAYPRWYLDGFGQVFSTIHSRKDGVVEFGRSPAGTSRVLERYGNFPLADVLNGKYLVTDPGRTRWTPVHAWMLVHFLFFSDTRRPQLNQYLTAIARGAPPEKAAEVFGDLPAMARELRAYFHARKPFDRVTYPPALAQEPVVRRLSMSEAAFVKGRLELGSRTELPPAIAEGGEPAAAAAAAKDRARALAARDRWLSRLREDAARYPADLGAQLLLAEAECRSGNADPCLAAADRALALAPADTGALAWRGAALAGQAAALPADTRPAALRAARATIGRANHVDNDAVLPLLVYYRSFAAAGEPAPEVAIDGLVRAVQEVPNAPGTRLALGRELAARGETEAALSTLRPVAFGPYASPEQPEARALAATLAPAPH